MIRYSTILFDFDGTLTPSLPLWVQAFQYSLEKYGVRLSAPEVVRHCFYRSASDIVATFEIDSLSNFHVHMQEGLQQAFVQAKPFDHVIDVLEHCRKQDVRLGIVTSSRRPVVEDFLSTHRLTEYFATLVTADDLPEHKPHPAPVYRAMEQLDSNSEKTAFIGDSQADLMAADAAGVHKGLFFPEEHRDFYRLDELLHHGPHFTFACYSELLPKLVAN